MMIYNKLCFSILTTFIAQSVSAINVDPVQIHSSFGELLYAEMNFRQSHINTPVEVSLANYEDLKSIGVQHNPPNNLSFFTRKNNNGTGVITITSSRPMTEQELNLVIKIKEGSETRLQHIKTSLSSHHSTAQNRILNNEKQLSPIMIVNEADIGLNLPTSSRHVQTVQNTKINSSNHLTDEVLKVSHQEPPALNPPITVIQTAPAPSIAQIKSEDLAKQNSPSTTQVNQVKPQQVAPTKTSTDIQNPRSLHTQVQKSEVEKPSTTSQQNSETGQHIVKKNESLWIIASRLAVEQNRSVNVVMSEIKKNNEHAFINGHISKLKRGVTLNLNTQNTIKKDKKLEATPKKNITTRRAGTTKYRLNQAEMSLVTETNQNTSNGSASKNNNNQKISAHLSSNVMTSREKAVKLQKNVTQLELALNQKDYRIQLLNARLAQLQQQLKNKQVVNKSNN